MKKLKRNINSLFTYFILSLIGSVFVMLTSCDTNNTVDSFEVDNMYCTNYPENCRLNEETGEQEIYCGKDHDGKLCECEVDLIGRPVAVRDCNVWSL